MLTSVRSDVDRDVTAAYELTGDRSSKPKRPLLNRNKLASPIRTLEVKKGNIVKEQTLPSCVVVAKQEIPCFFFSLTPPSPLVPFFFRQKNSSLRTPVHIPDKYRGGEARMREYLISKKVPPSPSECEQ